MLKFLPFVLIFAVTAIVVTRYLLSGVQQPLVVEHALRFAGAASAGNPQAHFADALKVSQLNAVQLDYSYTYNIYHSRGYMVCKCVQRGHQHLVHRKPSQQLCRMADTSCCGGHPCPAEP